MQTSKRLSHNTLNERLEALSRRNGNLQLELSYYRKSTENAMQLREEIVRISNELLNHCIIAMLSETDFNDIKKTSYSIVNLIEEFDAKQRKAYEELVAPFQSRQTVPTIIVSEMI